MKNYVGVVGVVGQAGVLLLTWVLGLGWGGPTRIAALVIAVAGLVLAALLARSRPLLALGVPVVSLAATLLLMAAGDRLAAATECSDREVALVRELSPPPGLTTDLRGEMANGCIARDRTSIPPADVLAHYDGELDKEGWTVIRREESGITAEKGGVRVYIEVVPEEDGLVLVSVSTP